MNTSERVRSKAGRLAIIPVLLLLLTALPWAPDAGADDVPEAGRKAYDQALEYVAAGGTKSLKKAFSALSRIKDKAPRSVDYWQLYVQVSRALKKPEKTIWTIIGKREAKYPTCPSFDLLRARLETDPEKKREHVQKATEKAPELPGPKLMLAELYLADEDPDEASEIIEAVLEEHPDNDKAIVLKGHVELGGGYNGEALSYADEQLKKKDLPALHHLKARAYIGLHEENDSDVLEEALKCAEKAVAGESNDTFVTTLAYIHSKLGNVGAATDAVETQYKKSGSPEMAALLGSYAVRSGKYAAAVPALTSVAKQDKAAARLLAQAHARLGNAKDARAIMALLLAGESDDDTRLLAARIEAWLGDPKAGLAHIQGVEMEGIQHARVALHARAGDLEAAGKLIDTARDDSDWSQRDDLTLRLMRVHVVKAMGAAAPGAEKKLRDALAKTAKAGFERPAIRKEPLEMKAKTQFLMVKAVTYFKSSGGVLFRFAGGPQPDVTSTDGKTIRLSHMVAGDAAGPPPERLFIRFNPKTLTTEGGAATIDLALADSDAPLAAYNEGMQALRDGKFAEAETAFAKSIEGEPHWHRAVLGKAVATGLSKPGERGAAAQEALQALKAWPDDHGARHLALLLAIWGGASVDSELAAYSKARESCTFLR